MHNADAHQLAELHAALDEIRLIEREQMHADVHRQHRTDERMICALTAEGLVTSS